MQRYLCFFFHYFLLNLFKFIRIILLKIKNRAGRTPMYEAQQNNHEKVVEFLLANVDPDKESIIAENDIE